MYVATAGPPGAPRVLLLHGGGVAGWMWDSLRDHLADRYHVIVPDLPGHGRSADEEYLSHAATVSALSEVIAGEPTAVVGFSLGAQLAVLLAAEQSEQVGRVMVVSAQARPLAFSGLALRAMGLAAGLAQREWFARLQARELVIPDALFADYFATSRAVSTASMTAAVGENVRFRPPQGWSRYPGEAWILVGGRERPLMRRSAADLHAALPSSRLISVERAGHGLPLQRPDRFNREVDAFLARASD